VNSGTAVRLVVFDAGGLIVRVETSWDAAQARAGIPLDERTRTAEFLALSRTAAEEHNRGEIDAPSFIARVAAASGLSRRQVEGILEAWIGDEYPGWDAVLDRLGRDGVETALLSNTNDFHWEFMAPGGARAGRYPAITRLDHLFASHRLGLMKPDPATYRAVQTATGYSGQSILFFDDRPENVAAAKALGWRAVQIDPTGDPAAQILRTLDLVGL
jgi:putative hydrolase of the HAD superfamily